MNHLCWSKRIVICSYAVTILLSLVAILGTFCCAKDTTALTTLAGLAWAETAASNAFYFWKAKNENRIKLTKQMVDELGDKYGIDAVVSLASIILKD